MFAQVFWPFKKILCNFKSSLCICGYVYFSNDETQNIVKIFRGKFQEDNCLETIKTHLSINLRSQVYNRKNK